MWLFLIFLSVTYVTSPVTCTYSAIDTFEFGVDEGLLVFSTSGSMGYWEKIKTINVIIPECMWPKYVRVEVHSHFGLPEVKFYGSTNTVIIEFSPLQDSTAQYTVIAKATPQRYCNTNLPPSANIPDFMI